MAKGINHTTGQLMDAEILEAVLVKIPDEKRRLAAMMTNSFIAGMEAQKVIDETERKRNYCLHKESHQAQGEKKKEILIFK